MCFAGMDRGIFMKVKRHRWRDKDGYCAHCAQRRVKEGEIWVYYSGLGANLGSKPPECVERTVVKKSFAAKEEPRMVSQLPGK